MYRPIALIHLSHVYINVSQTSCLLIIVIVCLMLYLKYNKRGNALVFLKSREVYLYLNLHVQVS